jgi:prepilin peptidase CpaA
MMQLGPDAWAYACLLVVLLAAAVCDVRTGLIYNWITYPAIVVGLAGHTLVGGWWFAPAPGAAPMGLLDALAGLFVGLCPLLLPWLAGGIGGGDAKIMGAVGALAGWRFALTAMFYGFGVALLMAIGILLHRRLLRDTLGRIGRFLWLVLVRARPGDPAGPESPKLPFGLALCIGSVIALVLTAWFGPTRRLFLAEF